MIRQEQDSGVRIIGETELFVTHSPLRAALSI